MNVCISVSFEAQTNSAVCVDNPLLGCSVQLLDPPESRMASRRCASQAKEDVRIAQERLAKERANLQVVAERNREMIAKDKKGA